MIESINDVQLQFYQRMIETPELDSFLRANAGADGSDLLLRQKEFKDIPMPLIVNQIVGRRKARMKLPTFAAHQGIIYPPGINLEQSSSEKTARLKAQIIAEASSGRVGRLADLTGGFGIDSYFFSLKFDGIDYVERDPVLSWIARHNHTSLGATNLQYHNETAEQFLDRSSALDAIYIDPSRRVASGKVIQLADCEPDIVKLQQRILTVAPVLLVKTSPLLDITEALRQLSFVSSVYVVSVAHECRELLFLSRKGFSGEPCIHTIHLNSDSVEAFDFRLSEEKAKALPIGPVRKFLYEPNPSIMKAGAFKSVALSFSVEKIHPNSHFFSSDELLTGFPGRVFEVIARIRGNGRDLHRYLPDSKANVVVRNYPLSADQLKSRLGLSDGGSDYVIGTTSTAEGKIVLLARRHR